MSAPDDGYRTASNDQTRAELALAIKWLRRVADRRRSVEISPSAWASMLERVQVDLEAALGRGAAV
jgi:hypothetical protein